MSPTRPAARVQPRDHMSSSLQSCPSPAHFWGDMYRFVPAPPILELPCDFESTVQARPRSMIRARPCPSKRTLSGFRSR
eukprot:230900-Prymnesium_polylepis.1